jgi:hypothetical protein
MKEMFRRYGPLIWAQILRHGFWDECVMTQRNVAFGRVTQIAEWNTNKVRNQISY